MPAQLTQLFTEPILMQAAKRIEQAPYTILPDEGPPSGGACLDIAEFSPQQERIIAELQAYGQELVDMRYSTGFPRFTFSPAHGEVALGYNNGRHGATFAQDAAALSEYLGLSRAHTFINQLVGPWHDIVQDTIVRQERRVGSDEIDSAAWFAKEVQQRHGLPQSVAALGVYGILGTWVVTDAQQNVYGQWATLCQRFPSKDAELSAKVAACADFGRLFAPEGPLLAHYLFGQRQGKTPQEVPDTSTLKTFHRDQLEFLLRHRYALKEASELFGEHRSKILNYSQKLIDQDERGETLPWKELLQQDITFMRSCNI